MKFKKDKAVRGAIVEKGDQLADLEFPGKKRWCLGKSGCSGLGER